MADVFHTLRDGYGLLRKFLSTGDGDAVPIRPIYEARQEDPTALAVAARLMLSGSDITTLNPLAVGDSVARAALGAPADAAVLTGSGSTIALLKGLQVAVGGAAVTASDLSLLPHAARALYVGGAGDIKVTTVDGSTLVLVNVPQGTLLQVAVTQVWYTGTSATSLVALW